MWQLWMGENGHFCRVRSSRCETSREKKRRQCGRDVDRGETLLDGEVL